MNISANTKQKSKILGIPNTWPMKNTFLHSTQKIGSLDCPFKNGCWKQQTESTKIHPSPRQQVSQQECTRILSKMSAGQHFRKRVQVVFSFSVLILFDRNLFGRKRAVGRDTVLYSSLHNAIQHSLYIYLHAQHMYFSTLQVGPCKF